MQIKKIFAMLAVVAVCLGSSPEDGNCRRREDGAGIERCPSTGIEAMKRDNPGKFRNFMRILRHIQKVNKKQDVRLSCAVAKALADHIHRERYRFRSEEHRLNFLSVLMGIIRVESAFNPEAVSHRNARGLMQVHWPTWKRYFSSPGEAHDLDRNLYVGTGILRLYMRQSDNDLRRALYKYLGAKDDHYADMVMEGAAAFKKSALTDLIEVKNEEGSR